MSVKVTVIYDRPNDPEAFEDHYNSVHKGLADKIPGMEKIVLAKVLPNPDGTPAAAYRTADLFFPDMATMQTALASPEGHAATSDAARIATGGITMMICELDA